MSTSSARFAGLPAAQIAALRNALWTSGYDARRVSEAMGAEGEAFSPSPVRISMILEHLPPGPLATLMRVFVLGATATRKDLAVALGSLSVAQALKSGLAVETDAGYTGGVRLIPMGQFVFAASPTPESRATDPEHVMGITASTITLSRLTIRRPVATALDVGTGCGVQAILAARHAARVLALDVNPQALRFTEFNAQLNSVTNVECREGDWYEGARKARFDLIIANPPFVISPESRLLYRDGGLPGDGVSKRIVEEAPEHLTMGGLAHVQVSWIRKAGDDFASRPSEWAEARSCDAWILHLTTQTGRAHAASWHQPLLEKDPASFRRRVTEWSDDLVSRGGDSIAFGTVILRRRKGTNWTRAEDLPDDDPGDASDQLERMFAAQDLLARLETLQQLLSERPALHPGHRLEQILRVREGLFQVQSAHLALEDGLAFRVQIDAFYAFLMTRLDGTRTLADAISEAKAAVVPEGVEQGVVENAALPLVKRLLELGFLSLGR